MDLFAPSSTCLLICGPMGSGKTTDLLSTMQYFSFNKDARVLCVGSIKDIPRQVERAENRKRLCLSSDCADPSASLSRASRDTEEQVSKMSATNPGELMIADGGGTRYVETHLGNRNIAYLCLQLKSVFALPEYASADVIGIDEGHLFADLVEFVTLARKRDNKHIVVAALDTDSEMHAFAQVQELMLQCTKIKKKNGVCAYCMSPSAHTIHLGVKNSQEKIGGFDSYKPVCFKHATMKQEDLPPLRNLKGVMLPIGGT